MKLEELLNVALANKVIIVDRKSSVLFNGDKINLYSIGDFTFKEIRRHIELMNKKVYTFTMTDICTIKINVED